MGSEADTSSEGQRPVPRWLIALAAFLIIGLVGFIASVLVLARMMAEPAEPPGLVVDNRTDRALLVFAVVRQGPVTDPNESEVLWFEVPEHTRQASGIDCGRSEYVARTAEGAEVERRGPFEDCNMMPWVIEATG
jgi:hypothetical protein